MKSRIYNVTGLWLLLLLIPGCKTGTGHSATACQPTGRYGFIRYAGTDSVYVQQIDSVWYEFANNSTSSGHNPIVKRAIMRWVGPCKYFLQSQGMSANVRWRDTLYKIALDMPDRRFVLVYYKNQVIRRDSLRPVPARLGGFKPISDTF